MMWLWLLLVLITALPSGDLQGRSISFSLWEKWNFPYCLHVSDHGDNEIFSGAEVTLGFTLERADSLFRLAPVSRAVAEPRRTVLKGLATHWSCSSCSQRPPWSCVLERIQSHLRYLHLVEAKDLFFLSPRVQRQVRTAVALSAEFLFREKTVYFWNKMGRGVPSLEGLFLDWWKSLRVFFMEWSIQSRYILPSVLSIYVLGKANIKHTELSLTILMDKSQKGLQKGERE